MLVLRFRLVLVSGNKLGSLGISVVYPRILGCNAALFTENPGDLQTFLIIPRADENCAFSWSTEAQFSSVGIIAERELMLAEADQLSLNRQKVDLVHQVKETVAHFNLVAQEQGIQLVSELDDPLSHPSLDENRVRQVLHNLLSNAFRHTPGGGTGLGLAIVKAIVDAHGGVVSAQSDGRGQGSSFTLKYPYQ